MNETIESVALTEDAVRGYRLLRDECGIVPLPHRRYVELRGEDRKGWLQGQATNDLRHHHPGNFLNFCLLTNTGQIEAMCSLWSLPDRMVVITDEEGAQVLEGRAQKMVILEDVQAARPSVELINIQGPTATQRLSEFVELPPLDATEVEMDGVQVRVLRSNRTGSGGWILVLPEGANDLSRKIHGLFEEIPYLSYRIACLEAGTPLPGIDTDRKTLLPELGPAFESANISYKKGCYMGQEVMMRIHSRGHVNRVWMGLYTDALVRPGDVIKHRNRTDAGMITSAFDSPDYGFIAAGYVRRESAYEGEQVTIVTSDGEVGAELLQMPILRMG